MFENPKEESKPPEPPASDKTPRLDKIELFKTLWIKFKKGTDWVNWEYQTHILSDGSRHYDPELETQIKLFEDDVIKPMEALWREMTDEERNVCDPMKPQPPETPLNPAS